jgi:RimJ/RimL family protein N-acetyltransferase
VVYPSPMVSDRISLRKLELEDIPRTTSWLAQPEIGEIMGYLPKSYLHQVEWFKKTIHDESRHIFAICDASGVHVGNVALGNIDWIDRNASLSLFIANTENRRKGYGRLAVDMILQFAFERLNLHRVYLRTSKKYPGAIQFWTSCGFVKEGILRQHKFQFGDYEDKIIFGMLREEYNAKKIGY